LAAHVEEFLDGLPEMSNCYCHPGKAGGWSFYIFSSGGSLNQSWIGSFEPEGCDELALLRHFLA
jgi:hypothetical protein